MQTQTRPATKPRPKKRKNNVQFVKHIMDTSTYGPLMQAFVIQALDQYSKKIANIPIEEMRKIMADNPVSPDVWHGCATELQTELQKHLER
jgi:hypothetical protein